MGRRLALVTLVFALAGGGVFAAVNDSPDPPVRLGEIAKLSLSPRPPVTDAQIQHIKDLIASLAGLDQPDFGLSASLSGTDFAPIPGQDQTTTALLTDPGLGQSSALKELVTIGPDALPYLLDALDNQTSTKVIIRHDGGFGGLMYFAQELEVNPVNPAEAGAPKQVAPWDAPHEEMTTYTVKVGDVCFVAIGQIVGRSYEAIRYQPTACIVVNSPTNDVGLCTAVRSIWKSNDPRRKVFDSLLADYATVGIFNGNSLDGWSVGSSLQCSAAMRMLYYFPKETGALLAGRLEKLNVGRDADGDSMLRCVANQVRSDYFINSVAWSQEPVIRASLSGLFGRAENLNDLLAALPAVDDKPLIQKKMEAQFAALPDDDPGPYGGAYKIITAMLSVAPDTAKIMLGHYLQAPTVVRCHVACYILQGAKVAWDIDTLLPLLSDTRSIGEEYAVVPGQNETRLSIRICDEAAVALSANHSALKFRLEGEYANLDRQAADIRKALSNKIAPDR